MIGSDQAAVFEGEIIGKPGSHANAVKQLQQFSGKQVQFISGIYLQNHQHGVGEYHASITQVYFKSLGLQTIENYLTKDRPYDCAGSFKVESLGILLFDKIINDDPTALEGLPLIALHQLFNRCGVQLLELSQD